MSREPLSAAQAAANVNGSAWVTAHAGTGKTYVLVTRFAALLLAGVPPQKILCLTYMRAAAAEMRGRVLALLAQWQQQDAAQRRRAIQERLGREPTAEELARAPLLYAQALDAPGGLNIQTIHAFCQSLLRRFALESGIGGRARLLDETEARALHNRLRARFVRAESASPAFQLLSRLLNEEQFAALTQSWHGDREGMQAASAPAALAQLGAQLGITKNESAESLMESYMQEVAKAHWKAPHPDNFSREELARHAQGEKTKGLPRSRALFSALLALREQKWRDAWHFWREACLNDGELRPAGKDANPNSLRASPFHWMRDSERQQADFRKQLQAINAALAHARTEAALQCGRAYLTAFAAAKRRRSVLDYEDLIASARNLLCAAEDSAWVQFKLDGGLDHVLLDEAQDTTAPQWEIVQALTAEFFAGEGRRETDSSQPPPSLFVVGDDKQAILSFQGSDPAQFRRMRAYFAARSPHFAQAALNQSHRTLPAVLQTVDDIFAPPDIRAALTPESEDALRHSTVRQTRAHISRFGPGYVELWAVQRAKRQKVSDDEPHVLPPDAERELLPQKELAEQVADKIAALIKTGAAAPQDILILVRSRNALMMHIVRALSARALPLMGADRMQLTTELAVMDLCAAARAALLPQDNLAVACFLRSPLGGVSEEGLMQLSLMRGKKPLWQALQAAAQNSADAALQAAAARLAWCRAQLDRCAPYDFFARLLGEQSGMRLLQKRLGADCADPVQEFLARALAYERAHAPSMLGFLHWLEQSGLELQRNAEPESGAIRLMTVHAAKGLEAKCVFLPQTCGAPQQYRPDVWLRGEKGELVWRLSKTEAGAPSLWPPHCRQLWEREQQFALESHARLLYVALTRARDQLYIGGALSRGLKRVPQDSWYDWIHRALKGKAYSEEWADDAGLATDRVIWHSGKPPASAQTRPAAAAPPPMPVWTRQPAPPETTAPVWQAVSQLKAEDTEDSDREEPAAGAQEEEALPLSRGRHMHFLLEHLPRLPPAQRAARGRVWLARHLPDEPDSARTNWLKEVLAVIAAPQLQVFFGAAARHEVPVMGKLRRGKEEVSLSGRVDVMVETEDKILVADFKTQRQPPAKAEAVAPLVLRQMAGYQALLRAMRPAKPVECWLIWSRTQSGMRLPDGLLARHWRKPPQEKA